MEEVLMTRHAVLQLLFVLIRQAKPAGVDSGSRLVLIDIDKDYRYQEIKWYNLFQVSGLDIYTVLSTGPVP